MWFKNDFFKITTGIIAVLLIIFLVMQLKDIFNLIFIFISAVFIPIIAAGVLYYILRPVRNYLEEKKVSRPLIIFIIYLLLITAFGILITFIYPYTSQQVSEFLSTPEEKLKEIEKNTLSFLYSLGFTTVSSEQLREYLSPYFQETLNWITSNIIPALGSIAKIGSFIIITPLLLFYLLKDDHKIAMGIINIVPANYTKLAISLFDDIDDALSSYISSQFIVACIIGFLIFIGYTLIGLKYSFALAAIALFFNLIPFAGPFISTIPAVIVGLSTSIMMVFKVILVVLVIHAIDLNFISPKIIGDRLNIHPVTVLLLLVASVPLFGFWGIFLITPLYAILKVLIRDFSKLKIESETKEQ